MWCWKGRNVLRVWVNVGAWRIFGRKTDEATGKYRKLCNAELPNLSSLTGIITKSKWRRMRWAGHVARMEKIMIWRTTLLHWVNYVSLLYVKIRLNTNVFAPWNWILLEKLTVGHLVKKNSSPSTESCRSQWPCSLRVGLDCLDAEIVGSNPA
jgi:hypothetical protein